MQETPKVEACRLLIEVPLYIFYGYDMSTVNVRDLAGCNRKSVAFVISSRIHIRKGTRSDRLTHK